MAPAPRTPARLALSVALFTLVAFVLGCASTGDSTPEPSAAEAASGRERERQLLEKTTPNAAAAAGGGGVPAPDTPSEDDAARPGRLLIYSAITGHVRLDERDPEDPNERYRTPAEREAARTRKIEAEIAAELANENPLPVGPEVAPVPSADPASEDEAADPLSAAAAPTLRDVPESLFATREVSIPPGQWQNRRELQLRRMTLDVDSDGAPEELRYTEIASGKLVRAELDSDFDGRLDTWITYENGEPVVRVLDTNHDSETDTWERYNGGQLEAKTLDRDHDGIKDTFFRYRGGQLISLLRDANNDGTVDRVEAYAGLSRTRTEEDRTLNGYMDTWTTYQTVDEREVVARIEYDTSDQGKPNVFETYETSADRTYLALKEEDLDNDGSIDVVSTYEDGRLVQRAISDEALSPL